MQGAFPHGEDWDYDLIVDREGRLERVQVKYTRSDGCTVRVRCRSMSLTNGKVRSVKKHTAQTVDWMAVYDATTRRCYYVPATLLGAGRPLLHLRLTPPRNAQLRGVHHADDFLAF